MTNAELQRERLDWEFRGSNPWSARQHELPQIQKTKVRYEPTNPRLEQSIIDALDQRLEEIASYVLRQNAAKQMLVARLVAEWKETKDEYKLGVLSFHDVHAKIFVRIENKMLNSV